MPPRVAVVDKETTSLTASLSLGASLFLEGWSTGKVATDAMMAHAVTTSEVRRIDAEVGLKFG